MVLPGLAQHRVQIPAPPNMSTTPKRSNRLHNFTLPSLRWGSQRYLRCANSSSAATTTEDDASATRDRRSPASVSDDSTASWMMEFKTDRNARSSRIPKPPICGGNGDNDDGIDAVRKKLVLDLKTAAEKMKDEIWRKNVKQDEKEEEEEPEPSPPPPPPPPAMESKPWNLRTRRREEIKPPISSVSNGKKRKIEEKKPNSSSPVMTNGNCESNDGAGRLPRLRSNSEKTKQRKKFCVQLSKKEIEEDFEAMVGRRPPRRPIKRPKYVQKQMDVLFPGLWLTEVTADWYKVPESLQKVRKGKGKMHFSESDDEES